MFALFWFIFGETSMCLCHIVSGNIRYVKKCFKNHDKTNRKKMRLVLFIRIEVYYLILPNKSLTENVISIYNT